MPDGEPSRVHDQANRPPSPPSGVPVARGISAVSTPNRSLLSWILGMVAVVAIMAGLMILILQHMFGSG